MSGSGFFFSLAKRYFELGTSMKRLRRLLSLLSFLADLPRKIFGLPLEPMKKSGSLLMYSLRMILLYLYL